MNNVVVIKAKEINFPKPINQTTKPMHMSPSNWVMEAVGNFLKVAS